MTAFGYKQGVCEICGCTEFYKDKKCKDCKRAYRQVNIIRVKENVKRWREANKDAIINYNKQYRIDNQEHRSNYNKEFYKNDENKKRHASYMKQWEKDNVGKRKASRHKRRTNIIDNGGSYTPEEWRNIFNFFEQRCLHPECLHNDLFYPLHSTENEKGIHIDHIISVINGGTSNIDNLQPLCAFHNISKFTANTDYRFDAITYLGLNITQFYSLIGTKESL